ncbi:hypothetical protein PNO31109_02036 [Pandoraea nosoerga]|uniref:Uncharacterized protein n=1 Tax=Pandoraea nosoerga TaxID=2508296 RepID=A0A5E4UK14_9BURK|nr:hypothetical protein PNO31109_02036 [Pandoraea nosoerga]
MSAVDILLGDWDKSSSVRSRPQAYDCLSLADPTTLAGAEAIAAEEGCKSISLHVFPDNVGAARLYQCSRYQETDTPNLLRKSLPHSANPSP